MKIQVAPSILSADFAGGRHSSVGPIAKASATACIGCKVDYECPFPPAKSEGKYSVQI